MNKKIIFTTLGALLLATQPINSFARDFLRFAGSGTVFPYVSATSENWSKTTNNKAPVIEQIGTGAGFKNFCMGMGDNSADVAMASRTIKPEEKAACQKAGVTDIIELKFGNDGITVVQAKNAAPLALWRADLFLAMWGENNGNSERKTWKAVDKNRFTSDRPLKIYGPGAASGTYDAFIELALEKGAGDANPKFTTEQVKKIAREIRRDGIYVDSGDNYNVIINKIKSDPTAIGVLGYSYLNANRDSVVAVSIDGIMPTADTIRSRKYPLSRPVFLYVKGDTLKKNANLKSFLKFFMDDSNIGDNGKMASIGLVSLKAAERAAAVAKIK